MEVKKNTLVKTNITAISTVGVNFVFIIIVPLEVIVNCLRVNGKLAETDSTSDILMLMATYKLIQDIEADDKLIWQLSFRQFVYALIACAFLYFSYLFLSHGATIMIIFTLPVALFNGFLAYPFGKDQPTEVWALAKLRFLIKPRKRIWAQSGVKQLVTVTVPKRVEVNLTNGLSQEQVKSRLQALADTIDSRGWTVKNVSGVYQSPLSEDTDRLISAGTLETSDPDDVIQAKDILDINESPIAKKMDELLTNNSNQHRQELIESLDHLREKESLKEQNWKPKTISTAQPPAFKASIIKPRNKILTSQFPSPSDKPQTDTQTKTDPDIINLARRNDLNINVIGREINKARGVDVDSSGSEVTVSLH